MNVVEQVESQMREAEDSILRELHRDFAESLQLPIEEVFRRNNAALAELLDSPVESVVISADQILAGQWPRAAVPVTVTS